MRDLKDLQVTMKSLGLFSILILNVLHCDCFHQCNSARPVSFSYKLSPFESNQVTSNVYSTGNADDNQSKTFLGRKKLSSISLRMSSSDDGASKVIMKI